MHLDDEKALLFCGLLGSAIFKYTVLATLSRVHSRKTTKVRVGTLSRLTVYPVKSMRGIDIQAASCNSVGLWTTDRIGDRSVMICQANYTFVTARQYPRLVLVVPSVHGDTLHLDTDGKETLVLDLNRIRTENRKIIQAKVWADMIDAVDCGDVAAEWISTFLDVKGLRVLYHSEELARRRCDAGHSRWHKLATEPDQVAFHDGFPFMMMSESSVADVNSRLEDEDKVALMAQFRPNFVVSGSQPFAEDDWNEICIGQAVFTNLKPCERCILTTVDTKTGKKDPQMEPLRTLRKYRLMEPEFGQSPCFGVNLVNRKEGIINVGDEIWATIKWPPSNSTHRAA